MDVTNAFLADWVKSERGRLQWLAVRTRLKERSLYNYCSGQRFSPSIGVLLRYAIDEYERARACGPGVEVSADDKEVLRKLAGHAKATIDAMLARLLPESAASVALAAPPPAPVSPPVPSADETVFSDEVPDLIPHF